MQKAFLLCLALLCFAAQSVNAQTTNQLRLLWELVNEDEAPCLARSDCEIINRYTTRRMDMNNEQEIYSLIGLLDQHAIERGDPVELPNAPRICQAHDAEVLLGFGPDRMAISENLDALKNLPGVHFSLLSLQGPAEFAGDFGGDLQAEFEKRFSAAGITLLTENQMLVAPGQPQLNVYFSLGDGDGGCRPFSIYSSLSQTAILTRDVTVKLKVGTWGLSEGPSAEFPEQDEYDAILWVADAFIADYVKANAGK